MPQPAAALQLGSWVGRRGRGAARLRWSGRELTLHIVGLQIVATEGDDSDRLSAAFGLAGEGDWFGQAQAAIDGGTVTQAEASAVLKRTLVDALRAFVLCQDAEVGFEGSVAVPPKSLTISFPHIMVESVLATGGEELAAAILPDASVKLRRLPDFARRAASLGLTEEGMAILAKINDLRSADDIAAPSPHGCATALRLLAAAVAGGLAEPAPKLAEIPFIAAAVTSESGREGRRRFLGWFLAVLALCAAAVALVILRPWEQLNGPGVAGPWAVAVDGGCQPSEVERLYRRRDRDPSNLRVVPFGRGEEQCYRLVWGGFADQRAAEVAMTRLPEGVVTRGFVPHVVRADVGAPAGR